MAAERHDPGSSRAVAAAEDGLVALLERGLGGAGDVISDPEVLASYSRDQAAIGLLPAGMPRAVVRPTSTAGVQATVRAASALAVPVVPRGAGSGLSGGANAIDGCVVLSLERMHSIVAIDGDALVATVQPGVVNARLREAAREEGLLYAPDPASADFCTIGGNIATNAGGLCCVKYGVTRDALLDLELVLAGGRAIRIGHRTRKGVAGYDLAGLVCGSEGTLGIVTEATVRLLPLPPPPHSLAASFLHLDAAAEAVATMCRRARPALLEIMDRTTMAAVAQMAPVELDLEAEAMLFAQSDAGPAAADEMAFMEKACERAGASIVVTTDEQAEGRMLLAARRLAYSALEHRGATLLDDVAVPVPALPALVHGVERIAAEHDLLIGVFGHAGDGNMHPTIVYDRDDASMVERALLAFGAILALARELGGTVTGEHGVGLLKLDACRAEVADSLDLQRAIKAAFDPDDILNPGKGI